MIAIAVFTIIGVLLYLAAVVIVGRLCGMNSRAEEVIANRDKERK